MKPATFDNIQLAGLNSRAFHADVPPIGYPLRRGANPLPGVTFEPLAA
jgi:hypothetical protein